MITRLVLLVCLYTHTILAHDVTNTLTRATVCIEHTYPVPIDGVTGVAGTAWFYKTNTTLVTAQHVADSMLLTTNTWTAVELHVSAGDGVIFTHEVNVRLEKTIPLVGANDGIAILALSEGIDGVATLSLTTIPLIEHATKVYAGGWANGSLMLATDGTFHAYADEPEEGPSGSLLFELTDGKDRLLLDYGASGGPVVNTRGQVVSIILSIKSQEMVFLGKTYRIGTPWYSPTHVCASIGPLLYLEE